MQANEIGSSLTAEQHKELNDAVNYATAFDGWGSMRRAMETGYCPTLRDDYGSRKFKKAIKTIKAFCDARGWCYFDGSKVVNG